ncbi:hypothetical protein [Dactylosporangium sp. CA-092794]|uniref:hypothetical protein n=1 Tax=Dactylosporangium sp. CA-092794 TaxID=3239929 RepID=UPI003D8F4D40
MSIGTVLDAAQDVIDKHQTSIQHFGRCVACGRDWPCAAVERAIQTFYEADRLPTRTRMPLTEAVGVRVSPVDWFGSGRVTTVAQGGPVPRAWKWRQAR